MKIKTADLIGAPLDWAVEQALLQSLPHPAMGVLIHRIGYGKAVKPYSTSGSEVIDIMEREGITARALWDGGERRTGQDAWRADLDFQNGRMTLGELCEYGPTLRIAVCRCFVASKLGDEVDVPEELLK